jgi:hypothetical protein
VWRKFSGKSWAVDEQKSCSVRAKSVMSEL